MESEEKWPMRLNAFKKNKIKKRQFNWNAQQTRLKLERSACLLIDSLFVTL